MTLSAFRRLERLPGAAHPAVYGVLFECGCGDEHTGLVAHDELDWAPLGAAVGDFLNLMTSRLDDAGAELTGASAARDSARASGRGASTATRKDGRVPCSHPRSWRSLPAGAASGSPSAVPPALALSVNLVTQAHVDLPFWNDASVGVVDHVFADDVCPRSTGSARSSTRRGSTSAA